VWVSPDAKASLGHARLSIIDLETGDQPIASEDERLRIVVNGEFYDFERTRAQLERDGHRFRTRSDSEIALHLYEDRGLQAIHALRGEFAWALWDGRDGQLHAARDRCGIKPLYYTTHRDTFYLASEIKALAALGVPLEWDQQSLYDFQYIAHPPDRTLFKGVHQLPPGHCLTTDGAHVRLSPYWDWDYPLIEHDTHAVAPDQLVERLRDLLEDAIRVRLRADVPVACYLSGGLDSCAVVGFAARLSSRPLRAFTLSFDSLEYDEVEIAREQASRSGVEFRPVNVRSKDLADNFAAAVAHAERPFMNGHAVAKFLLSRAVRDAGIKVVLTGEGSDEIFAGYPHFRRDHLQYGAGSNGERERSASIARLEAANLTSAGTLMPKESTSLVSVQRILGFTPSHLSTWAEMGAALIGLAEDGFVEPLQPRDTFRVLMNCLDVERQLLGRHVVNQSLYIWSKTLLPNYALSNLGDRMEMAHSVEGRLPFLDHHVVREATRLPVSMKIHDLTEKYVLREASRPVLIDMVYERQKHPFMSPPATWQPDSPLYTYVQDTLRGTALARLGIYSPAKMTRLLDTLPALDSVSRTRLDGVLTWATSLCVLGECMREFNASASASTRNGTLDESRDRT
jgi:asparagine synthase (glutamine-hydrolysing)